MCSTNKNFLVLNFCSSDLDRIACRIPGKQLTLLQLARGISSSPIWRQFPDAELVVRNHPPAIAVIGNFDETADTRLNALGRQIRFALRTLRYVSYDTAAEDCRILALHLIDRFGIDDVKKFYFSCIPRGGIIVLGMLSYLLDLEHWQLKAPQDEEIPVVVIDDCSFSGKRFKDFLNRCPNKKIIFAPLYSHPDFRSTLEKREPRVLACISARDIKDYTQQTNDNPCIHEKMLTQLERDRYWLGSLEYLCFAWNEPDSVFWNEVTEKAECGWNILPSEFCAKNSSQYIPIQIQPEYKGRYRIPDTIMFSDKDAHVVIGNSASQTTFVLQGFAAEVWKSIFECDDMDIIINKFLQEYDSDEVSLRHDVESFIEHLISQGILEYVHGSEL